MKTLKELIVNNSSIIPDEATLLATAFNIPFQELVKGDITDTLLIKGKDVTVDFLKALSFNCNNEEFIADEGAMYYTLVDSPSVAIQYLSSKQLN